MKPTNFKSNNCESKSANCVLWDHESLVINGVTICKGDSVAWPIYQLALAVKDLQSTLDITNYTLGCLPALGPITDFKSMIQKLINKACL